MPALCAEDVVCALDSVLGCVRVSCDAQNTCAVQERGMLFKAARLAQLVCGSMLAGAHAASAATGGSNAGTSAGGGGVATEEGAGGGPAAWAAALLTQGISPATLKQVRPQHTHTWGGYRACSQTGRGGKRGGDTVHALGCGTCMCAAPSGLTQLLHLMATTPQGLTLPAHTCSLHLAHTPCNECWNGGRILGPFRHTQGMPEMLGVV